MKQLPLSLSQWEMPAQSEAPISIWVTSSQSANYKSLGNSFSGNSRLPHDKKTSTSKHLMSESATSQWNQCQVHQRKKDKGSYWTCMSACRRWTRQSAKQATTGGATTDTNKIYNYRSRIFNQLICLYIFFKCTQYFLRDNPFKIQKKYYYHRHTGNSANKNSFQSFVYLRWQNNNF